MQAGFPTINDLLPANQLNLPYGELGSPRYWLNRQIVNPFPLRSQVSPQIQAEAKGVIIAPAPTPVMPTSKLAQNSGYTNIAKT